jgi:hypothetical protein
MGFGLVTRLTDHLLVVTTSNSSAVALQITRAHAKSSQFVFTSHFLVRNPNNVLFLHPYWQVKVTLRLTVSLGVEHHLGLMTRYLLLYDSHGLVFVGRPL